MDRNERKESVTSMHVKAIVETAQKLFAERGIEMTTMDDIAAAAQYSKRTVYTYFSSKRSLHNCVVLSGIEKLCSQLRNNVETEEVFLEKYRAFCRTLLNFYRENKALLMTIINYQNESEALQSSDIEGNKILGIQRDIYLIVSEILEAGQRQRVTRQGIDVSKQCVLLWRWLTDMMLFAGRRPEYVTSIMGTTDEQLLQEGFATLLYTIQARYTPFKAL